MKKAAIIMLLAAAMLPVLGHAQTVNICDRTPQVRDEIMLAIGADDCAAVTARQLAGVGDLCFSSKHLPRICRSSYSRDPLIALKAGDFDGLYVLTSLDLSRNRLTTLPNGVFDDLEDVELLDLSGNRLTALPAALFDGLLDLDKLDLRFNHLVGLARNDLLFATLPKGHWVEVLLDGQTEAPKQPPTPPISTTPAFANPYVPLLVSASDSMRQGFVRVINESNESGTVRVLAFDDAGVAADPIEITLAAKQALHFNAGDLENGNANKGINAGIGSPAQGHWRLDVETALDVRVLAFVRTGDGFLTAMHDVLQRDSQGRLTAWTFNPASNTDRVSRLRLVNTGATAESVSI